MKIETKRSAIEILDNDDNDDEDFFSQVAAVEAEALASSKRRRLTPPLNSVVPHPKEEVFAAAKDDGLYMAALKGNQSLVRQSTGSNPLRGGRVANGRVKVVDSGNDNVFSVGGGGDSCFKCGKSGHWARDCDSAGGGGGGGNFVNYGAGSDDPSIQEKSCPCGLGVCNVLTANTEKNRGRKFYKCPLRQEMGGCGFFEWCDNTSGNNSISTGNYASDSSFPGLPCPCGAGLCLILTAKTGKNIGQQFYKCPANQGSSCGFFKWCNENITSVGVPVGTPKVFYNSSDTNNGSHNVRTRSSCFKCGKEGHWAKDCSIPSFDPSTELGGRSASSGTCYKCSKPGHWSRDCSSY